jgi:hypothetical protein
MKVKKMFNAAILLLFQILQKKTLTTFANLFTSIIIHPIKTVCCDAIVTSTLQLLVATMLLLIVVNQKKTTLKWHPMA